MEGRKGQKCSGLECKGISRFWLVVCFGEVSAEMVYGSADYGSTTGQKVDVDYLVLERLLIVSRNMPLETIRCVRLMCESAGKQWEISSWLDEIKEIISLAIRGKRSVAREEAVELGEYLTARGFRYFDDLLDEVAHSSS
jgi:hypothetical protein